MGSERYFLTRTLLTGFCPTTMGMEFHPAHHLRFPALAP